MTTSSDPTPSPHRSVSPPLASSSVFMASAIAPSTLAAASSGITGVFCEYWSSAKPRLNESSRSVKSGIMTPTHFWAMLALTLHQPGQARATKRSLALHRANFTSYINRR